MRANANRYTLLSEEQDSGLVDAWNRPILGGSVVEYLYGTVRPTLRQGIVRNVLATTNWRGAVRKGRWTLGLLCPWETYYINPQFDFLQSAGERQPLEWTTFYVPYDRGSMEVLPGTAETFRSQAGMLWMRQPRVNPGQRVS